MKMKKICATILSTAAIASLIAGCSKQIAETSDTGLTSSPDATATVTSAEQPSAGSAENESRIQEPQSFEELYGNQLMNYMDHHYFYNGEAIPTPESNFYFINSFLDLSNYASMGYYPATNLGYIDLSAEYSGDVYDTFGDYFVEYAENSIESTCILYERAVAAGVTLPQETKESIDAMFDDIKNVKAVGSGMTLDEYLQFYYGPGNDEANFRKVLERYYIADEYSRVYCQNYPFTEEEKNVPFIRYALFYAPEAAEQDTKDKALEEATEMKDACKSIDDLTGLAESALDLGTVYDQGDIAVPKGQMVPKFEEWAYGEGRKTGELDIIYAPEYGYFVVGYLGLQEQDSNTLDQIALRQLSTEILDEIEADKHNFHTEDEYLPAPAGPTATPIPDVTTAEAVPATESEAVFDPNATAASDTSDQTSANSTMTKTDVLVVVFLTLAGVAIVAVIIILIAYAVKNSKNGKTGDKNSDKNFNKSYKNDDDEPAEDGSDKDEKDADESEEAAEPDNTEADDDEDE